MNFLHQSKLPYAKKIRQASILYFYSPIRRVNERSGSQNFTASLLPNRMHSSHFVFANVLTISVALTSFPSHGFSKLMHSVEPLILGAGGDDTKTKPTQIYRKPMPPWISVPCACLGKTATGRTQ